MTRAWEGAGILSSISQKQKLTESDWKFILFMKIMLDVICEGTLNSEFGLVSWLYDDIVIHVL